MSLQPFFCRKPLTFTPSTLAPRARLSLISRHLEQRPVLELNTPFSTERQSGKQDDVEYIRFSSVVPDAKVSLESNKMSSQTKHPSLLIPGPVEFDDDVLQSMSYYG